MKEKLRDYVAFVWKKNSDEPGVREAFVARDHVEARAMLEEKHGVDIMVSLIDVEAAERPR